MRSPRPIYASIGILALGLVATLALVLVVLMSSINRTQSEELHSCQIDNVTRALDNQSHYTDYKFYTQQINFTKGSVQTNYQALLKIGISKSVLDNALKQTEATLMTEEKEAASKTWTTLTNCNAPNGNLSVKSYPISQKMVPASAMDIKNAAKATPVGSIG